MTVPGQVQVAVASDSAVARTGRPALTAVDLHPEEIGAAAVGLLANRMAGEPPDRVCPRQPLPARGSTRRARQPSRAHDRASSADDGGHQPVVAGVD